MSKTKAPSAATISVCLALALASNACFVGHASEDDSYHHSDNDDVEYVTIDAGHTLSTDLGQGAGLFVEYQEGGHWTIWSSCDTDLTGSACFWDVLVTADSALYDITDYDLEGYDSVSISGNDTLYMYAETASRSDTVRFSTDPGALVQMEVLLDGQPASRYFVWYGNGDVQTGSYAGAVVFQPDQP